MPKTSVIDIYQKYYSPDSQVPSTPKMDLLEFAVLMSLDPTARLRPKMVHGRAIMVYTMTGQISWDGLFRILEAYRKGRYLQWIIAHRAEINFLQLDDMGELLHDALLWFDCNKPFLEVKDINQMNVSQLFDLYNQDRNLDLRARHEVTKAEQKGAEVAYIDDDWAIVVPKTFEASCFYGQFTKWCTTARDDTSYFYDYSQKAPLYIVIHRHSSHKYQFFFHPGEYDFRNEIDHAVFPWDVPLSPPAKQFFRDVCGAKGLTTDELNAQLSAGVPPEEVFDYVGPLQFGYRLVKQDMRYNYYNPQTNQLVGKQWFFFAEDFKEGRFGLVSAKVWLMRYSFNYLLPNLHYRYTDWSDGDDAWSHTAYYGR